MNCPKCGAEIASNASFCEYCGQSLEPQAPSQNDSPVTGQPQNVPAAPQKKENLLHGIVGAIIGAAIGGVAIVVLGVAGYVASICGLILAICTLKGYELLGGKLSTKGVVVCLILMAITPYIADRISWAIVIMDAFKDQGVTFAQAFAVVHEIIAESDLTGDYVSNLVLLYVFALLGSFGTIRNLFKKK